MMFKALKMAWKSGSILSDVLHQLVEMAQEDTAILSAAWNACANRCPLDTVENEIRNRDKQVNRAERTIRRLVVQHLTINPGQDVSGCVAVLLIAKDMERIGDHGRNIFTMARRMPGQIPQFRHFAELDAISTETQEMMGQLELALKHTDRAVSTAILERYVAQKQRFKDLLDHLLTDELRAPEAVATSLLNRYFKRIAAHIGNATSGIIFPVENIDFVSRGLREEEKDR